jgi:hypothetical protein
MVLYEVCDYKNLYIELTVTNDIHPLETIIVSFEFHIQIMYEVTIVLIYFKIMISKSNSN